MRKVKTESDQEFVNVLKQLPAFSYVFLNN